MRMAIQLPLTHIRCLLVGLIVIRMMIVRYDDLKTYYCCAHFVHTRLTYNHFHQGDFLCFDRDAFEEVPGCFGTGESGKDYCWDRASNPDLLFYVGNNDTWIPPLQRCEGKITITQTLLLFLC